MSLSPGWTLFDKAILSTDGRYRYWLRRSFGMFGKPVVFAMLNPSTATAEEDDPTIRRCIDFAKRWGASDMCVVNLFALRSTDPAALFADGVEDPEGPGNDTMIEKAADFCRANGGTFVCAWGSAGKTLAQKRYVCERAETVLGLLDRALCKPMHLRVSEKTGQPWHPLYLPATLVPQPFKLRGAA
jgi:hypothetical protein